MCDFKKIHSFILGQSTEFPYINNLFKRNGILTINRDTTKFYDFIFKTIISQQISFKASKSIWDKVESFINNQKINLIESIDDEIVFETIQRMGISLRKMNYILDFKNNNPEINSQKEYFRNLSEIDFKTIFKENKGIGNWTCDMIQIFYFRNLNVWPNSDLIIEKILNDIQKKDKRFDLKKRFFPYLSIVALHFWKYID